MDRFLDWLVVGTIFGCAVLMCIALIGLPPGPAQPLLCPEGSRPMVVGSGKISHRVCAIEVPQ